MLLKPTNSMSLICQLETSQAEKSKLRHKCSNQKQTKNLRTSMTISLQTWIRTWTSSFTISTIRERIQRLKTSVPHR